MPYSSPASPGRYYESVLLSIGCQPTPRFGLAWPSGQKSHPRRILGSPCWCTSAGSSDVSRLGLASKAPKTYLGGPGNLIVPFVPFVSEDTSHVSNFRQRVPATSEKFTPGVARRPQAHIMPCAPARVRVDLPTRPHVDRAAPSPVDRVARPGDAEAGAADVQHNLASVP